MSAIVFPSTYFAQHKDGTFYETTMGPASYKEVLSGILSGQMANTQFVWQAKNGTWSNVTVVIVNEVFRLWMHEDGEYVPPFLKTHASTDVERELRRRQTAAEIAWDRAENDADAAYDRQREYA